MKTQITFVLDSSGSISKIEDGTPTPPEIPCASELNTGDPYPVSEFSSSVEIAYEFSVDADGNPFRKMGGERQFRQNDACIEIAEFVHRKKGGGASESPTRDMR